MPAKKPSKGTKKPVKGTIAKKGRIEQRSRIVESRIAMSGKTTRGKGHLGAATRRSQAKRDAKKAGG